MTIISATIDEDGQGAWFAVDTLGQSPNGDRFHISKLYVLPTAPAVLAVRGRQAVAQELFRNLVLGLGVESFDALVADTHEFVDAIFEVLRPHMQAQNVEIGAAEVAVIGWSEKARRFVGKSVTKQPGEAAIIRSMANGHIAPWDERIMGPCPIPRDPKSFMETAKAQVLYGRRIEPSQPIGGSLVLARLGKSEVTIWNLGAIL